MTKIAGTRAEASTSSICESTMPGPSPERIAIAAGSQAEQNYARALHRHLGGMPVKEIDFFVNARRFDIIERLVGDELRRQGSEILNVACGPFALEFYMQLGDAKITSFDREEMLAALHSELLSGGYVANTEFLVADVYEFMAPNLYDAVIINDLFYSKYVDFYALIGKYAGYLKPDGLLYFDIQDERAGPIWRAFGKDAEYRRYDLKDVASALAGLGLTVTSVAPSLGIKGGLDGVLRKGLWHTSSIANSFVFVARKS
jgi:SAM-dependent methyltransferase